MDDFHYDHVLTLQYPYQAPYYHSLYDRLNHSGLFRRDCKSVVSIKRAWIITASAAASTSSAHFVVRYGLSERGDVISGNGASMRQISYRRYGGRRSDNREPTTTTYRTSNENTSKHVHAETPRHFIRITSSLLATSPATDSVTCRQYDTHDIH